MQMKSKDDIEQFFQLFYNEGSFEKQNLIIGRSVKSVPVSHRRVNGTDNFKRNNSCLYFLPT